MNTSDKIEMLMRMAAADSLLRSRLLESRQAPSPAAHFCAAAADAGVDILPMDLISFGEEEHAAMKRSTNGGGENTPALEWQDDYFEILMSELEMMN